MAADGLATQSARAPAAIVLVQFDRIILVSLPERLFWYKSYTVYTPHSKYSEIMKNGLGMIHHRHA